jgi:hypothetical protein
MKKIALLTVCLLSVSLHGSHRPSPQDLKRDVFTNSPSNEEFDEMDDEKTYKEICDLEEKGAQQRDKALEKLARRKHSVDRLNSREIINQ